jgi:glycosyltransferase involved in cell wall biosynthesis
MKVLLSAFSCAPHYGSEPGVGWNWAVEVARMGHEVVALTSNIWQAEIEEAQARGNLPVELRFAFFMPGWLERVRALGWRLGFVGPTEHVVHLIWQCLAWRHVERRFAGQPFDVVHHITYGGIRHPTFMGSLPYPLVLGPLGGGERSPIALRGVLPLQAQLTEVVRDIHTCLLRFDPITVHACERAMLIYVKTIQSKAALPERLHSKIFVEMEIGVRRCEVTPRAPHPRTRPLRLLYAGRFLPWKGQHLGLAALAKARDNGGAVELTVAGRGPSEAAWRALARRLQIEDYVRWVGWVPYEQMNELYRSHDALLFPSLHDSSGNAVLEAMSMGLPVICLDLGGPGTIVDSTCGFVVSTKDRTARECILGLAGAIEKLYQSPELCASLSAGALCRARDFEWPKPVVRVYREIERRITSTF